jgi:hypothetical protein
VAITTHKPAFLGHLINLILLKFFHSLSHFSSLLMDFVRIFDFLSLGIDLGAPAVGTLSLDHFESLVRGDHEYVLRSSSLI